MLEQGVGIVAIGRQHGDADPRADPGQLPVHIERLLERSEETLAQCRGARWMLDLVLHHRELIGAHAGERVRIAQNGQQARAGVAQQQVARGAAKPRVDPREVDQVQQQYRGAAIAAPPAGEIVLEARTPKRSDSAARSGRRGASVALPGLCIGPAQSWSAAVRAARGRWHNISAAVLAAIARTSTPNSAVSPLLGLATY
jgi:hypothetical protein